MEREYIPIGNNCLPTFKLKGYGLRKSAYPFDWQVTSMQSFYEVCKNNFDGMLDDICIGDKVHRLYYKDSDTSNNPEVKTTEDYIYPVICKKYNILFPHYFHKIDDEFVESVRNKMKKRIESFRTILKNKEIKKYFTYTFYELNNWQQSCFKSCGVDVDIFSEETHIKYLNQSINLFSNLNVEFINLNHLEIISERII